MALNPLDALTFNPVGAHTANSSLATDVTLTVPDGATKILVQALSQDIRYTLGGTTPTTTLGFQLKADDQPVMIPLGGDTVLKFIEETATATLQYQFGN